jgi:ParB family chromosome partitioning protein
MLALIAEEMTVAQGLLLSFIDNETGRDLSPYEQAQCFQTMVNDLGYSPEQVAEKLGRTLSEVSWGLGALNHLPSAALDAWQEGGLSTSHVKELMRVEDDSLRGALLERTLKQDLSVARLAFLVDQARQLDQVPTLERPLFELRDKLQQNSWISLRMQAGQIGVEDSRTGDRLSLNYSSPEELLELLQKLINALS